MTPSHHPSDATLFDHAGGSLSEVLSLAVATHLSFCAPCREKLGEIEAVGGILLNDLPPEALSEEAFAKTLAMLDRQEQRAARPVSDAPAITPLRALTGDVSGLNWKRLASGISAIELMHHHRRAVKAMLFRVSRGIVLPRHGHSGREMTVVLEGGFADETGVFAPGDFIEHDEDIVHRPAVGIDEECVCLIAVEGRLRFKGLLGAFIPLFVDM